MTEPQEKEAADAAHYASGCRKPPLRARFFARASSVELAKQSQLEARAVLAEQSQASIGTASGRAALMVGSKKRKIP